MTETFFTTNQVAEKLQMRATLEDFQYNDNGLSLNVDQVGKIAQSYANMLEFYRNMIKRYNY